MASTIREKRLLLTRLVESTEAAHLSDLTADRVEHFLREMQDAGLSGRRVNYALGEAKAFLAWYEKRGRLAASPLIVLSKVPEDRVQRRPLTEEELDSLCR